MRQRIHDAHTQLDRIPEAYRRGLAALVDSYVTPRIRSPLGGVRSVMFLDKRDMPVEYGVIVRPSNGPESRPPSGGDPELRCSLVSCTQALVQAVRSLFTWDWRDITAWHPTGLAYSRIVGDVEYVSVTNYGAVCWRDPDDPGTRLLSVAEVRDGTQQQKTLLRALEGWEFGEEQDADTDVMSACLDAVDASVRHLRRAGVWELPEAEPEEVAQCRHCDAKPAEKDRKWCSACRRAHQPDRMSCRVCGVGREEEAA